MNILQSLAFSAGQYPGKAALIDESETVTYAELFKRARSIGTAVAAAGKVNHPVVVMIDRNAASVAAFYGVTQSRNFYVPCDASQPAGRIRTILLSLQPLYIISVHGNLPDGV